MNIIINNQIKFAKKRVFSGIVHNVSQLYHSDSFLNYLHSLGMIVSKGHAMKYTLRFKIVKG